MLLSHTLTIRGSDVASLAEFQLGGDSLMDGGRDRWNHGKIMSLSHTLTMKGSDVASLVEFLPVV